MSDTYIKHYPTEHEPHRFVFWAENPQIQEWIAENNLSSEVWTNGTIGFINLGDDLDRAGFVLRFSPGTMTLVGGLVLRR